MSPTRDRSKCDGIGSLVAWVLMYWNPPILCGPIMPNFDMDSVELFGGVSCTQDRTWRLGGQRGFADLPEVAVFRKNTYNIREMTYWTNRGPVGDHDHRFEGLEPFPSLTVLERPRLARETVVCYVARKARARGDIDRPRN